MKMAQFSKLPKSVVLQNNTALRSVAIGMHDEFGELGPHGLRLALEHFADSLETALKRAGGAIGLALPQLNMPLRGFVISGRAFYPGQCRHRFCFDPVILKRSIDTSVEEEGCLSLVGRHLVRRANRIEVSYTDRNGNSIKEELSYYAARVFQHELDHLDGILIDDPSRSVGDEKSQPR